MSRKIVALSILLNHLKFKETGKTLKMSDCISVAYFWSKRIMLMFGDVKKDLKKEAFFSNSFVKKRKTFFKYHMNILSHNCS